jgi:hypothetical protein
MKFIFLGFQMVLSQQRKSIPESKNNKSSTVCVKTTPVRLMERLPSMQMEKIGTGLYGLFQHYGKKATS